MLKLLGAARSGMDVHTADWTAAAADAIALSDESGDDALRMAVRTAGAYPSLIYGDLDQCERLIDEALEIADGDHGAGTGIVIACPYAWGVHCKAVIHRDRGEFERSAELFESALRIADEQGDLETEGWARGNFATLMAYRGDLDGAVGLAQRNYKLTERLGDVFSRQWTLVQLAVVHLEGEEWQAALDCLERADRLFREAMGTGGEAEAWRIALIAEALLGLGRAPEALERAEQAVAVGRERALLWAVPRALRSLARARIASGEPGAEEALAEAEELAERTGQAFELEKIRDAALTG